MAEGGTKLDVSCSICFEEYDTPKVLTCGHTFCCQCLSKMLDKHLNYLKCPKCRKEVLLPESGEISDLPTNFELMAIIENQSREETTTKGAVIKKEEICQEEVVTVIQCLLHVKPLEFYCKSCRLQICTQCLLKEHKPGKHDIVTKSDCAENLILELNKLKQLLQDFKSKQKTLGVNIVESEISLEQQYSEIQNEINGKVAQEQAKIKEKGDILLKELADKKAANSHLLTDLKIQHFALLNLSNQTGQKCTLLGQEFIKFNFSGDSELVEIQNALETLHEQIESLRKTYDEAKEVGSNFHNNFQWDLGKLIPTAEAERLDKAAGGNCNSNQKNVNYDDYRSDHNEHDWPSDGKYLPFEVDNEDEIVWGEFY